MLATTISSVFVFSLVILILVILLGVAEKKLLPHQLRIQHSQAGLISQIRKFALIVNEDYEEDRICLSLRLPPGGKTKLENLFSSR